MKSQVKKGKDCKTSLNIELGPEVIGQRYLQILGQFKNIAKIPGFRPGKAPSDLVLKHYGKDVEDELLKSLVPEAYHQAVSQNEIKPVALPAISDINLQMGKKLTFTATVETAPEFNLKNYKGIKIKKEEALVSDEDLKKALDSIVDSRSEYVPVTEDRPVQQGDFIIADIEFKKDDQFIPGRKGVLLAVEPSDKDDFFTQVVGAAINEVREITVEATDDEKKSGSGDRKVLYKVWVRQLRQKQAPELTDELAKLFGKESLDDLKSAVRQDIFNYRKDQAHNKMKDELYDKLVKLIDFTMPQGLVDKQRARLISQAKSEYAKMGAPSTDFEKEQVEIEKVASERAKEQVKLYFILDRIAELEQITEDEAQVQKRLEDLSMQAQKPLDEIKHLYEEDIRHSLREKMTSDFLIANAKFEE